MERFQGHFSKWTANQFMMWVNGLAPCTMGFTLPPDGPIPEGALRFKDEVKIDVVLMDPCAFGREDEVGQYERPRMPLGNKDRRGKWLLEKVIEEMKPSVVLIFADCCGPYSIETQEATRKMFPQVQWIFLHFCDDQDWHTMEHYRHAAEKALRNLNLIA